MGKLAAFLQSVLFRVLSSARDTFSLFGGGMLRRKLASGLSVLLLGVGLPLLLTTAALAVPPTAGNDSDTTIAGFVVQTTVVANDEVPSGSTGYPQIVGPLAPVALPSGASVVCLDDGYCTYTPTPNAQPGTDTYQYTVADSSNLSETATATVTITQTPNSPPVAADDEFTVGADRTFLEVGSNDTDLETAYLDRRARLETPPLHGTVVCSPPVYDVTRIGCLYQANYGYVGPDSFTYRAADGTAPSQYLTSAPVTVTLNVTSDHAPGPIPTPLMS